MIDYDKLKLACKEMQDFIHMSCKIAEKELTQPEPKHKYERNTCMWTLSDEHEPTEFYIHLRDTADDGKQILYGNRDTWKLESELYPTKAQLIETQIEYWSNMQIEENGCHENGFSHKWNHYHYQNGKVVHFDTDEYKCRKCDRLYKFEDGKQIEIDIYEEPEYCNVSGAKLGKREECEHETNSKIRPYYCIKCGEFYR